MRTNIKIITEGWPGGDEILLDSISCTYIQESDCTEDKSDCQEIVLSTRDGGGGKFINIKTDNWSVSDEEDLVILIKDFKKRYEETSDNS